VICDLHADWFAIRQFSQLKSSSFSWQRSRWRRGRVRSLRFLNYCSSAACFILLGRSSSRWSIWRCCLIYRRHIYSCHWVWLRCSLHVMNQVSVADLLHQMITNFGFLKVSTNLFFDSIFIILMKFNKLLLWLVFVNEIHFRGIFAYFRSSWPISKGKFMLCSRLALKSSGHQLFIPLQLFQMNVLLRNFVLFSHLLLYF
jgi:hypothetical protein